MNLGTGIADLATLWEECTQRAAANSSMLLAV